MLLPEREAVFVTMRGRREAEADEEARLMFGDALPVLSSH
jgi:hypothetical protein